MSTEHHIAVIGVAGRFPGARDADQFWDNLRAGRESIAFPTDDVLRAAGVPEDLLNHPGYVKALACPPDVENFDAALFGYTPREAQNSDPQIRMFLECAHAALENAGYDPYGFTDSVGVYASAGINRYIDQHLQFAGDASATSSFALSALNYIDYVGSTVAYKLNLRGPVITLATACSSSLVATHLASQALRNGECDVALAGGVDVEFPHGHGYLWEEGGPVSPDGHVRPFDVKASGTVFGGGCGVVVLKRLTDAIADGDTVLAVIRGSAVNNDGSDKAGFSAPSVSGQAAMLTEALAMAGVSPSDVSYVECHATGTPLGDPIEVAALNRAYRALAGADLAPGTCALGSVKANIGHLGHAAGVASLIKAVLALANGQIPPTANFTEPNPKLRLDGSPFVIADRLIPWPRGAKPRVAGVSSFGVGGTNAHLVLEEGPVTVLPEPDSRPRIVVWSAKSEQAERDYRGRLAEHLRERGEAVFPATVGTLQEGRRAYPIRRAVVADSAAAAVAALDGGTGVIEGATERREVVLAFPGQGAQQVAMAVGLYGADATFTRTIDTVFDLFEGHGVTSRDAQHDGVGLRDAWREAGQEQLNDTTLAQPLLFAVEYALARMLLAHGVRPTAVLGHSVGELAAAAVAEVFTLPDAVALVAARARAMRLSPPGGMLAVARPADDLGVDLPAGLSIALVNGPKQTVLSGPPDAVEAAAGLLRERRIPCTRLKTAGAFHSPLMAAAATVFAEAFDGVSLHAPTIALYSSAAGRLIDAAEATDPSFWSDQVATPVRFDRALDAVLAEGRRVLVETGPGHSLTAVARTHSAVADGSSLVLPLLPRTSGAEDHAYSLRTVARLWAEGQDVSWSVVRGGEPVRRVPVPGYPYQRKRHWVESSALRAAADDQPAPGSVQPAPAETTPVAATSEPGVATVDVSQPRPAGTPFSVLNWVEQPRPEATPSAADHDVVLLAPADPAASLPLILAVQQAGLRPVIARPGPRYEEVAGEFRIRPTSHDDLGTLLATLTARGTPARLLIHALTVPDAEPASPAVADQQLDDAFHSLLTLVQVGARHPVAGRAPALLVLTSRSVDMTGAEPVDPVKATVHGLARSVVKEAPHLVCRVIDVAAAVEEDLAAEIALWDRHDVVALRGPRRWVRAVSPFHPAATGAAPIRRRGVYLVTGGLGGLGMVLAKGLASTGLQPRLVLVGRTGLAEDATDDRALRLRAQIRELEALGAQVRVVACDVTDRRAVRRAVDTATARFGPVNGVLHLAGLPGDGLAQLRTRDQAVAVLGPKVHGTLALAEAFTDRAPLDFFVCFSSRASTDGLVGSADYAAANAFQDAYTALLSRSGTPALSINWPSWARVGMAAEFGVRTWTTELSPTMPLLDEHRLNGEPVMPGTGHIDMMLRAFAALRERGGPVKLKDIVFHQVLVCREPRRVEVRLHPDGRIESWSRPSADPAAEPVRHASAVIAPGGAEPSTVDLGALHDRLPWRVEYNDDIPRLFKLGPRWQNEANCWALPGGDTTEQLLELVLADEFVAEIGDYAVHPTLLDTATGSVRQEADGFHLPFLYNSLVVYEPLPARCFAHIRRLPSGPAIIRADVDLVAPDGRLLVQVGGYTMRRTDAAVVTDGSAEVSGDDVDEIEPRDGVRLTLALLGSRHPGQVLVEPGARPVPVVTAQPVAPVAATPSAPVVRPVPAAPVATAPAPAAPAAAPVVSTPGTPAAPVAAPGARPGDHIEEKLTALWVEAIGDPSISPDADFFELGGNSLTAVGLMTSIRDAFGADLSIAALFDYPTIRSLASVLREQGVR